MAISKDGLKLLLKRPVSFNKVFVDICGSVNAALLLSQAFYWTEDSEEQDGISDWFWKTTAQCQKETGLSYKEQKGARDKLLTLRFLSEQYDRTKHHLLFQINFQNIFDAIEHLPKGHMPKGKVAPAQREDTTCPKGNSYIRKNEIKEESTECLSATPSGELVLSFQEPASDSPSKKKSKADPRYVEFMELLARYWQKANGESLKFSPSIGDCKQLKNLLAQHGDLTREQFYQLLINRYNSEKIIHSQEIRFWLPSCVKYLNAPLDEFSKPIGTDEDDVA